jgi:hypothetical protein
LESVFNLLKEIEEEVKNLKLKIDNRKWKKDQKLKSNRHSTISH